MVSGKTVGGTTTMWSHRHRVHARAAEFGLDLGSIATNMAGVQCRKQGMVESLSNVHLDRYQASGVELHA